MKGQLVLGFAVLLGVGWAMADATLVLKDGQVLQGVEARREGDVVVLRLASGDALSFPADLVAEIRIGQPAKPGEGSSKEQPNQTKRPGERTSSGLTAADPQTLAGQNLKRPNTREQLEVLGAPAQFSQTGTAWRWTPKNSLPTEPVWDEFNTAKWPTPPVDPRWTPDSAFDLNEDVLARGRVEWPKPAIDPTWTPSDGFKRWGTSYAGAARTPSPLRPGVVEANSAAKASLASPPSARPMTLQACAEKLAAMQIAAAKPPELRVRTLSGGRYAWIPLSLYELEVVGASATLRAVFALVGDDCRLVGGDLAGLMGVSMAKDQAALQAAANYNLALGGGAALTFASAKDKIAYALSVVSLTSPDVSGGRRAELVLVSTKADLEKVGARAPKKCAVAAAKRKKDLRRAATLFTEPTVTTTTDGSAVRFFTLSNATGELARRDVFVSRTGHFTLNTEVVATHLGDHAE